MRWNGTALALAGSLIAATSPAHAQTAIGDWQGRLEAGGNSLRIAVHISAAEGGGLSGTLDSLDQNTTGIPLAEVVLDGAVLRFTVPTVGGAYRGEWQDGGWAGQWSQGGQQLPLTLSPGAAPAAPQAALPAFWTIPDDAAIGALLEQRIAARPGVGIVAGLIEGDGWRAVARGPGGGTGFDPATEFEIGSLTKLFTALLLADMAGKGEVALDDPAQKYLPEGATMPRRGGREITLRDLAMHVSGLPRLPDNMPYGDPADPYADYGEAELLAFLSSYQLPRDIGSQFEYSNLGAGLLGYLLQRAAGKDYETLLRERITGKLGMTDTRVSLTADQQRRLAQGHDAYLRPAAPWQLNVLVGAGGIHSTTVDLLRFAKAVADPRSPIASAVDLTLQPRAEMSPGTQIGLGWLIASVNGRELLFHTGGTGGHRSAIVVDRAGGKTATVLTNAAVEPSAEDIALHLLTGRALAPLQPIPLAPAPRTMPEEVALSPEQLDRLAGVYEFSDNAALTITREGAGLKAQMTGQPTLPIHAQSPLEFFWRVVDARLRFETDESGAVTGAVLMQNGAEMTGRRKGAGG